MARWLARGALAGLRRVQIQHLISHSWTNVSRHAVRPRQTRERPRCTARSRRMQEFRVLNYSTHPVASDADDNTADADTDSCT